MQSLIVDWFHPVQVSGTAKKLLANDGSFYETVVQHCSLGFLKVTLITSALALIQRKDIKSRAVVLSKTSLTGGCKEMPRDNNVLGSGPFK